MNLSAFKASLSQPTPPQGLSTELQALWYDGRGDWQQSHEIAQKQDTPGHCLIHAYLHRKEGDNWNANYWYRKARRTMPNTTLAQEWEALVGEFL